MAKITGFGGIFLRSQDPAALYSWYREHLSLESGAGGFTFDLAQQKAESIVSFFPSASAYFPAQQPAMLNFQVDDLDAVLDRLAAAGVAVEPKREAYEYGRFGWFFDPEGNKVELWQPTEE